MPATRVAMSNIGMQHARRFWLWWAVGMVAVLVFWAAPGGYGDTATALLHGLCAQTPSHTLVFGERPLPFDARMTGIYGGVALTVLGLARTGRLLAWGTPPARIIVLLGSLVALMGVDGTNSLLRDLGVWHPYEPSNAFRVLTGFGAGAALAVALCWLLGSTLWRLGSGEAGVRGPGDLGIPIVGLPVFAALLAWRPEWLHLPVSMLLVLSAWMTVSILMLVMVLLVFRMDGEVQRLDQLHVPVAIASLFALAVMLGLAGGRYWVEQQFGLTNALL